MLEDVQTSRPPFLLQGPTAFQVSWPGIVSLASFAGSNSLDLGSKPCLGRERCEEDERPRSAIPGFPSLPVEMGPMAELEEYLTLHSCTPSTQLCASQRQPSGVTGKRT